MFHIYFYTFAKKENSTARPSTVALDANCIIKTGSGIMEPTIELDLGLSECPEYNYCYIPAFGRYYWIREWYFEDALWTATLLIDVLATAKNYIGSSSLYVLRAASAYDGYVRDELYPADANFTITSASASLGFGYSNGVYVLGIVSKAADFGSLRYYVLTTAQMSQLVTMLLSDGFYSDEQIQTAEGSVGFVKCLVDPIQYIKSCIYIPIARSSLSSHITSANLIVFDWDTEIVAAAVNPGNPVYSVVNTDLAVSNHPQAASRGKYLNDSPYTSRVLYVPPFGAVELDPSYLIEPQSLTLEIRIDLTSGMGTLDVRNGNAQTMNYIEGMVGVPVNLSQVMRDWIGATQAIAAGAVGSVLNPANIGSNLISTIGNVVNAMRPKCQSVSGGGSYASLRNGNAYLTSKFAHMVADDLAEQGRPLCQTRTISSLSGYVQVMNGDIAAPYTADELERIRSYLEGGFYYE